MSKKDEVVIPFNFDLNLYGLDYTMSEELNKITRPDLNDEEFEKHLQDTFLDEDRLQCTGGFSFSDENGHPTCFGGHCGKCSECYRKIRKGTNGWKTVTAGGFVPMGNNRHYQVDAILKELTDLGSPEYKHYPNSPNRGMMAGVDAFGRPLQRFNKVGISRRPMLPIGNNWLHRSLITGGGFRKGEFAMISAGAPDPLNRFKSNWLGEHISSFVARGPEPAEEKSILQLFAEPEITGNDFYHRLRNLVNAGLSIHTVRIPGGTRPEKIVRYTGSTDHSTFIPDNVRRMVRTVDISPFIEVKGWGIWVGGKKICTMPLSMRDMVVDSVTSRWQTRGQYGAYGQVTLDCPTGVYEHATEWLTVGREEWAEEAIDRLIYNRVYGVPHQMVKNGSYIADQLWGLRNSNVQFVKQQARERLRAASNPERQKRGY